MEFGKEVFLFSFGQTRILPRNHKESMVED